ncbi:MAG TPA: flagellar motor switch protein FliN [Gaiellales bacterium]|nr:flagellar motor switch protein FliN [Gaiellales bacterium]
MSDELEIRDEPGEVSYEPLPEAAPAQPAQAAPAHDAGDLDMVLDVPVELSVEIGRTTMTIRETLEIGPGAIITLNKMTGEPVDLLVNGRRIARGEVVAIDEEFGLRVTQIVSPQHRLDAAA